MNNFEAKYIKMASAYLDEKLQTLEVKKEQKLKLEDKKESTLHRIMTGIFKS
jgi:hypothetical protein